MFTRLRTRLDERPLLIVPTAGDVIHYQRELAEHGGGLGAQVLHFGALTREIAHRSQYEQRPIGELQRRYLVDHALDGANLELLSGVARSPGFTTALVRLFAELEGAGIGPARFTQATRTTFGDGTYEGELAQLYSAYRRELERLDRVDRELFAHSALERLAADPVRWNATPLFFYGYDDLTDLELAAVTLFVEREIADLTVSLTYEPGRPAFESREQIASALELLACEHVALPAQEQFYRSESAQALHRIERDLFEFGVEQDTVIAGEAIQLLEAGGERSELELVAAEVLELLRNGTGPERIAVVFRSPERYGSLIDEVFSAYEVPFWLRRRLPLTHTTLGRSLLALLCCAFDERSTANDLLTYLRAPGRVRKLALLYSFEAQLRSGQITALGPALALWEERAWPLDEIERLRAVRSGGVEMLGELRTQLRRLFVRILSSHGEQHVSVLDPTQSEATAVYGMLSESLDQLRELSESGLPVTPDTALTTLAELSVGSAASSGAGRVHVCDPLAIRARRYEAVFVVGLVDGEFPQLGSDGRLLGDRERIELARRSGLVLRLDRQQLAAERFLFYQCVSRPERALYLSYRTSDEEGAPSLPSFFISELRGLCQELVPLKRTLGDVTWPLSAAPTARELERSLAVAQQRPRQDQLAALSDPAVKADLAARDVFSASSLERLTRCSVRWFIEDYLRPNDLDPDHERLVFGRLAHTLLERVLHQLRGQTGSARISGETLPLALELLERSTADLAAEEFPATDARSSAALRRLSAMLGRYFRHEAELPDDGFWPTELELSFGLEDSDFGPLELGEGEVSVRGRIDRLDGDGSDAVILRDYKTGRGGSSYSVAQWERSGHIQVPLYMLAVRRLLGRNPVGGLYQSLAGDELRARGVITDEVSASDDEHRRYVGTDISTPEAIADELARVEQATVAAVRKLRAGELEPCAERCLGGSCAYPGICRGGDS